MENHDKRVKTKNQASIVAWDRKKFPRGGEKVKFQSVELFSRWIILSSFVVCESFKIELRILVCLSLIPDVSQRKLA
jgi:inorganic pyrophosphatase/exopolyphosphatase